MLTIERIARTAEPPARSSREQPVAAVLRVPVHVLSGSDVREVPLMVRHSGPATDELLLGERTVGFIRHDGQVFVALSGRTPSRARECGHSLLWDAAAACLLADADASADSQADAAEEEVPR